MGYQAAIFSSRQARQRYIYHVMILLYSQKYWRELNLAVGSKIAIAKILVDLNLAVR